MNLISVILPVYNGQRTIRRCLKSVMDQTYPHIEIVVVNDGSIDKSKEIIEEDLQNDTKSIIIHKEKNEGIEKARHTGIAASNGQLIAFIDQDDYLDCYAIEKMEHAMSMYDADLVQCHSDSFITLFGRFRISLYPRTNKRGIIKLIERKGIESEMLSFYGCGNFSVSVWAKLYKKEMLNNIEIGNFLYGDDLYLNMQVFPKLNRICVIPDVLYHYERQGTSSKFIPLWMEECKHLYQMKIAKTKEMQSEKALLFSSIELRNCFKVYVESMILFKVDSEEGVKQWINQELQDDIYDMFEWLRNQRQSGHSAISLAIMNKDIDAIYDLCRKSVYEWKWKKIARRILIKLS